MLFSSTTEGATYLTRYANGAEFDSSVVARKQSSSMAVCSLSCQKTACCRAFRMTEDRECLMSSLSKEEMTGLKNETAVLTLSKVTVGEYMVN